MYALDSREMAGNGGKARGDLSSRMLLTSRLPKGRAHREGTRVVGRRRRSRLADKRGAAAISRARPRLDHNRPGRRANNNAGGKSGGFKGP